MSEDILYEAQGHVRLITIDRPAVMNSLDFAANEAITACWRDLAETADLAKATAAFCEKRPERFEGR